MVTRYHAEKISQQIDGSLVLFDEHMRAIAAITPEASIVEERDALRTQLTSAETRVKRLEAGIEQRDTAIAERDKAVAALTEEKAELVAEIEAQAREQSGMRDDLRAELDNMTRDRDRLRGRIEAIHKAVEFVDPPQPEPEPPATLESIVQEFVAAISKLGTIP